MPSVVKKLPGEAVFMMGRVLPNGGFYQTHFNGVGFGVGKMVKRAGEWEFIHLGYRETERKFNDYFEYAFKVEGDLLTVEADGEEVLRVRDSEITGKGEMAFSSRYGQGLFKKAEIKILD
jgi:predicted PolB exonuclease-like 3'-5' exonuclease